LDESAAVCGFEANIDDKKLIGVVKESEEAKDIYDDAIASGKGAYLLEAVAPDVFQV
jgi:poly [ADP-ribose] polymerase